MHDNASLTFQGHPRSKVIASEDSKTLSQFHLATSALGHEDIHPMFSSGREKAIRTPGHHCNSWHFAGHLTTVCHWERQLRGRDLKHSPGRGGR